MNIEKNSKISIIEYSPEYKSELINISVHWLKKYNVLEDLDLEMLNNPEKILKEGGHIFFAQYNGSIIVGTLTLAAVSCNDYEILKFGVKEEYQGLGIGRMLMEKGISTARNDGKINLILESNHQLTAALRLYEKLGFEYIPCVDSEFELSDIKMKLILK